MNHQVFNVGCLTAYSLSTNKLVFNAIFKDQIISRQAVGSQTAYIEDLVIHQVLNAGRLKVLQET